MDFCESVDSDSAITRVVLGFGSGASDLKTAVEGSLMTERGCGASDPVQSIPGVAKRRGLYHKTTP